MINHFPTIDFHFWNSIFNRYKAQASYIETIKFTFSESIWGSYWNFLGSNTSRWFSFFF